MQRSVSLFVLVLIACGLLACDQGAGESFSTTVVVTNAQGVPVEDARVGVRPCLNVVGATVCTENPAAQARADKERRAAAGVEGVEWASFTAGYDAPLGVVVLI
jgi:hypothetical protein